MKRRVTSSLFFCNKPMKYHICISAAIIFLSTATFAQKDSAKPQASPDKPAAVAPDAAARQAADAALAAHGGDSLRKMKSFIVRGSCDVAGSPTYVIPATFAIVIAGDKYSFEVNNPIQPLKQVFDGKQTYS